MRKSRKWSQRSLCSWFTQQCKNRIFQWWVLQVCNWWSLEGFFSTFSWVVVCQRLAFWHFLWTFKPWCTGSCSCLISMLPKAGYTLLGFLQSWPRPASPDLVQLVNDLGVLCCKFHGLPNGSQACHFSRRLGRSDRLACLQKLIFFMELKEFRWH